MDLFLRKTYKPVHAENRMKHEGDVQRARTLFYERGKRGNLYFLLSKRFGWMNEFIHAEDRGIEVGCGTGVSKEFISCRQYQITDFTDFDYLDFKNIDALNTGFTNESFDFVVSSNMIHHVPYPVRFFEEMHRILKPGGKLLIQEINGSWCMRAILRLMRHEGYSYDVNVFDRNMICTDPEDLWSANCVIPNLLFDNRAKFNQYIQGFDVRKASYSEFFTFLNSGGVIAKTAYLPLPGFLLKICWAVDDLLCKIAPGMFALQCQIVLEKKV
jgi:SAM-dependent methyltransferase